MRRTENRAFRGPCDRVGLVGRTACEAIALTSQEALRSQRLEQRVMKNPSCTSATEDTTMDHRELTLTELLDDPMTIAVMAADHVDPVALEIVLSALSRKLGEPRQLSNGQMGFECNLNPMAALAACG